MRLPRFVRRLTDPLVGRIPVRIASGVNRGLRWSLVSAGSYASGRRDRRLLPLLVALIRPGDVFWDVGAHHGFVTLCAARCVGPDGVVHAFEPSAPSRALITRHVSWNRLRNVVIHPYALSAADGEALFGGSGTSKTFALGGGTEQVPTRRADTLIQNGECPAPTFMKVDVEGAEGDLVRGALQCLRPDARLLIALHSARAHQECGALLEGAGFTIIPSRKATELSQVPDGPWPTDPDIFAMGPRCQDPSSLREILQRHDFNP